MRELPHGFILVGVLQMFRDFRVLRTKKRAQVTHEIQHVFKIIPIVQTRLFRLRFRAVVLKNNVVVLERGFRVVRILERFVCWRVKSG